MPEPLDDDPVVAEIHAIPRRCWLIVVATIAS